MVIQSKYPGIWLMAEISTENETPDDVLRMAVDVVAAYVSNNRVSSGQVREVIETVFSSMNSLSGLMADGGGGVQKPAVPVRRSVTPDYIVCLEDGKKLKMLKRHLRTAYGLTPAEYRSKWKLPADYPMVAPNYAKQRSEFAKKIGLGRKPGQKVKRRRA